jgi:hypothetical protein
MICTLFFAQVLAWHDDLSTRLEDLSQIFSEGIVRPVDVGVRRPARRTVRPV